MLVMETINHLKGWFLVKDRPLYLHINSAKAIRAITWNMLGFPSIQIDKPFPEPVQSFSEVWLNFRKQLELLPQIRSLVSLKAESKISIVSVSINITNKILQKNIDP